MNRRELIKSLLILPIIPYLGTKYTTPETDRVVYKLINNTWVEYPFDELIEKDIFRISTFNRTPNETIYKVHQVFPYRSIHQPNGISVELL